MIHQPDSSKVIPLHRDQIVRRAALDEDVTVTVNDTVSGDLDLAHRLASVAREIALHHLHRGVATELKQDGTPVTKADVEIEYCLREMIARHRPGDAVLGEELGASGASNRLWLIDPIDGTFNYASGKPQWGTHVALQQSGEIVLGVITRPALDAIWWASRGGGAHRAEATFLSGKVRLQVSLTTELRASRVTVWSDEQNPISTRLKRSAVWVEPHLDAILHLAEGRIEAVVDPSGKPWDHAPAVVIVEEAGGQFSSPGGGHSLDLGEGRYTNRLIHHELEDLLDA